MDAVNFFSKEEKALIKSAVQEAELNTSGAVSYTHLRAHET